MAIVSNERSSPVLLSYEEEIISEAKEVIGAQAQQVSTMKQQMAELDPVQRKFCQAMELEVIRWKYLLQTYHSTRFKKIQTLIAQLTRPLDQKLSVAERAFCDNLQAAVEAAVIDSTVEFNEEREDEEDGSSAFVFFKALDSISGIQLSGTETNEPMDIEKNQICFARFSKIRRLVEDQLVVLL